ncbi:MULTISPECIES: helix-turn-helix transcriptional regulator [Streptomyces]|uniref:Helix-turn-helix domain-containing protein n=1 Tax=Streptomyces lycii TaxID=2654337 RepID=A0ABQ7FGA9_9ACTN|nr:MULTISPECIES: helix-turn-helix transcriptional regulator [Streptomyces]KAF4407665.1 helix-turn-helix domain-containing protein [Streptomyces lycii]PGH46816.1 transcriptional regulator [Streptomyces sp. Ru87]
MPPRSNPTARQERLGAELRKLREQAGITARDAASLLGSNPIQMSHVEAGRSGISEKRIRRLAAHYACDDAELVEALVAMANERHKGWWEAYRGLLPAHALDLAEAEHHAKHLRALEVVHIPGLFQIEDHIRASVSYVDPTAPPEDLEARIAFRVRRREVIERDGGTGIDAMVHEAALRIRVGGRKTARRQLEYLLELSQLPRISVRVIPFETDFAGAGHSVHYLAGAVEQLDTAHVDTAHGGTLLDASAQVRRCRARLDRAESCALPVPASRDLVHRIAQEL